MYVVKTLLEPTVIRFSAQEFVLLHLVSLQDWTFHILETNIQVKICKHTLNTLYDIPITKKKMKWI